MNEQRKPIYLVQMNHFDPIWRRCWDRRFEYAGQSFASYADIEQAIIDDWIESAGQGATTFVLEQTLSLRKYIERRPAQYGTLRRLARERRFEVLAGGEVIPDANMPLGESLVRNLVYGILWAEKTLGVPVTIGCRNDGFGSSAQIPQIFRQCEIRWLPFLTYRVPAGDYWRGLDGSTVYVRPPQARLLLGANTKLRPCEACKGKGCDACRERGFDQDGRVELTDWLDDTGAEPFGLISLGGEETLPCMDLEKRVADRGQNVNGVEYRFGLYQDLLPHIAAELEAVDNPPAEQVAADPDIALASSGCWVTRIRAQAAKPAGRARTSDGRGFGDVGVAAGRRVSRQCADRHLAITDLHAVSRRNHCHAHRRGQPRPDEPLRVDRRRRDGTDRTRRLHDHRTPGEHRR